jgi:hypothetical protein
MMNNISKLIELRNKMQKEIIFKVVSKALDSDSAVELNNPQEFSMTDESGYPVSITVIGVDCNTGKMYDNNDEFVEYKNIPIEVLGVIHHMVVISEEYIFKPIMFI